MFWESVVARQRLPSYDTAETAEVRYGRGLPCHDTAEDCRATFRQRTAGRRFGRGLPRYDTAETAVLRTASVQPFLLC